jgi:hypothetical protein
LFTQLFRINDIFVADGFESQPQSSQGYRTAELVESFGQSITAAAAGTATGSGEMGSNGTEQRRFLSTLPGAVSVVAYKNYLAQ